MSLPHLFTCTPSRAMTSLDSKRPLEGGFQGEDTLLGCNQQLKQGPSGQSSVTTRE